MDHFIGCYPCAVTVAYAVLRLEVLLHYSAVKVVHIKGEDRGSGVGGGLPCPFMKTKKNALIVEKKPLNLFIFMLNQHSEYSFQSI